MTRRPFDLALSLGVPHGGEAHEAAIAHVLDAAKRAGKTAAIFCARSLCRSRGTTAEHLARRH
jgi:2-keto-3-deoxy-L-rhamnonate aldolase RhmA